jgi:hypothetical protein
MLLSVFSFKGLKHPSNRSSPKLIELFVRLKTEVLADKGVSGDVSLFVA